MHVIVDENCSRLHLCLVQLHRMFQYKCNKNKSTTPSKQFKNEHENHRNRAKLDSPNTYVHGRAYIYTSHGTGTSPNLIPRTHMYMAAQSYIPGLVQALPKLDSLNTHVHGRPIIYSGLGTSTSILSEGLYSFMKPNLHS
jgi:hypothetical protein